MNIKILSKFFQFGPEKKKRLLFFLITEYVSQKSQSG